MYTPTCKWSSTLLQLQLTTLQVTLFLRFIYTPVFAACIKLFTGGLGLYFSLECIAFCKRRCVTSNVWKSGQETSKFVRVIRMFLTVSVLILQRFVKSGQIWDARSKMGQVSVPGDLWFFPGLQVKNRDCPGKSGTDGHLTLGKIWYLWKCSKFFGQIYSVYRERFRLQ